MMDLTRGDTGRFKFQRLDAEGHPITAEPDAIYFTVKSSFSDKDFLFQKKKSDMTMDNDGTWHFTIESTDTENLPIATYVYDIEVISGTYVQTITKGMLKLTAEATWYNNR